MALSVVAFFPEPLAQLEENFAYSYGGYETRAGVVSASHSMSQNATAFSAVFEVLAIFCPGALSLPNGRPTALPAKSSDSPDMTPENRVKDVCTLAESGGIGKKSCWGVGG